MSGLVIDSGVVVHLVMQGGVAFVHRHPATSERELLAPHLLDPEFLGAARRLVRLGKMAKDQAGQFVREFARAEIERFPHASLVETAWSLRDNMSAYDAMYVALAMKLDVPLLTTDRRLAGAAAQHCETIVLEE